MRKWHRCSNAPKIGVKCDTRWGRGCVQCCTSAEWVRLGAPAALLEPSRPPDTPDTSAAGAGTSSAEQHRRNQSGRSYTGWGDVQRTLDSYHHSARWMHQCFQLVEVTLSLLETTDRLTDFSQVDKPLSVACLACCDPYDHYIHKKSKVQKHP